MYLCVLVGNLSLHLISLCIPSARAPRTSIPQSNLLTRTRTHTISTTSTFIKRLKPLRAPRNAWNVRAEWEVLSICFDSKNNKLRSSFHIQIHTSMLPHECACMLHICCMLRSDRRSWRGKRTRKHPVLCSPVVFVFVVHNKVMMFSLVLPIRFLLHLRCAIRTLTHRKHGKVFVMRLGITRHSAPANVLRRTRALTKSRHRNKYSMCEINP